jgi:hypothetical protein
MRKTQTPQTSKRDSTMLSLEQLIGQQGVQPANDLDAIGALWPSDDDPEAFERFVSLNRQERREHVKH